MQSQKYNKVKRYFKNGLWNDEMVKNSVIKKWITDVEYKQITGKDYDAQL